MTQDVETPDPQSNQLEIRELTPVVLLAPLAIC
jgi:hypothetical protein